MSDAITDAITGAMAEAGLSETSDSGEIIETVDSGTTVEADAKAGGADDAAADADGDEPAGAVASPSAGETPEQKTAREAEEAELTIRPGENAIPQKRVKKMVLKGEEKGEARGRAAVKADLDARDKQIAELVLYQKEYQRLNHLADNNPEQLIEALAVANPAKWKPIQARLAGAPQVTAAAGAAAEGRSGAPRPKPNFKLPDDSFTYDEAGLDELLQWTTDNAVSAAEAKILKQMESRMEPLEKEGKAAAYREAQKPRIATQIREAREQWGDLFEQDYKTAEAGGKSEILTYMNEKKVNFEKACTAVLLPKVRAERNKMRKELIAEANARPAAAAAGPKAAVRAPAGPRTIEQVIKDSMDAANLT